MSSEHAKVELRKSQQELKHLLIMAEIFVKFPTIDNDGGINPQKQSSVIIQQFNDNEIIKYYLNESERYINRIETLYNHCYEPWDGLERHVRDVMTKLREKQNQLYIMLDNNNSKRKQQQQLHQSSTTSTSKTISPSAANVGHQPLIVSEQQQQHQLNHYQQTKLQQQQVKDWPNKHYR